MLHHRAGILDRLGEDLITDILLQKHPQRLDPGN